MGLFEAAASGTVFLDEVGEMSPAMQAKLLRALEEREVVRVGEHRPRRVDVRIISATNRDLAADIAVGRFRADLYYRLAAFPIRLPALRDRPDDIVLLAQRFVAAAAAAHSKRIPGIDPSALELLATFHWPGNVRELRNEIDRAVALARDGEPIGPRELSARLREAAGAPQAAVGRVAGPTQSTSLPRARAAFERHYIADVLRQHDGNVSRTAKVLGLSRVMLQRKLKAYGLR